MEAISFGIPIVGTAVSGTPEIVIDNTGFLIPKEFSSKAVSDILCDAHKAGKIYSEEFRKKIQDFYKENFYAPLNHELLAQKLAAYNE